MARARNIKPSFFLHEGLGTRDPLLSLLFAGLWCLADRDGLLQDRPLRIKAEIFPYRESLDVNGYLTELSRLGLIRRFCVGEGRYIQIPKFNKHQHPHKTEKASELPNPDSTEGVVFYHDLSELRQLTVKTPLDNGSRPADLLIPDSLVLIPDSLIPDSGLSDSGFNPGCAPPSGETQPPQKPAKPKTETPTAAVWKAYATAYALRYGVEPVRNATVNGQLANLVQRLGAEEAPHVAAHYVRHNKAFYVAKKHPVGVLLTDAEGLRTEWATNRVVTETEARQADRRAATANAFSGLIEEAERREANAGH